MTDQELLSYLVENSRVIREVLREITSQNMEIIQNMDLARRQVAAYGDLILRFQSLVATCRFNGQLKVMPINNNFSGFIGKTEDIVISLNKRKIDLAYYEEIDRIHQQIKKFLSSKIDEQSLINNSLLSHFQNREKFKDLNDCLRGEMEFKKILPDGVSELRLHLAFSFNNLRLNRRLTLIISSDIPSFILCSGKFVEAKLAETIAEITEGNQA